MGVSRFGELNIIQTVNLLVRPLVFLRLRSIPELWFFQKKFFALSSSKLVVWTGHERENDDFVLGCISIPFAFLLSVSNCDGIMISHSISRKSCIMFNSYGYDLSKFYSCRSHGFTVVKITEELNVNSHGGDGRA
jgi:hypothetical protein